MQKNNLLRGLFGGVIIVIFHFYIYASGLSVGTAWPTACFKNVLLGGFWMLFPLISGLLSRICEPHHRLIAVYEGASAPALFLVMAHAFPFYEDCNFGMVEK